MVKGFDIDRNRSFRNIEWVTVVGKSGGVPLPDNISRQGGFYNPPDDSVIVSVRHQDAVIKLSRETGELVWILGTHAGWGDRWKAYLLNPVGEFEWPYHQHAARTTRDGLLLLFDNGNDRAWPPETRTPDKEAYSRAVEFKIDEEQGTVEQVSTR